MFLMSHSIITISINVAPKESKVIFYNQRSKKKNRP